jgi:hypothetical protein
MTAETDMLLRQLLTVFRIAGGHDVSRRGQTQQADGQFAPHLHSAFFLCI